MIKELCSFFDPEIKFFFLLFADMKRYSFPAKRSDNTMDYYDENIEQKSKAKFILF